MLIQSTVSPSPRICVLLGGLKRPTPPTERRLAALLSPASRLLQQGTTP